MGNLLDITKDNFDSEVIESAVPVIVDFWAPWCGPCRMIAPIMEGIAEEYGGKVKVCKINTDEQPELATRFNVLNIPTIKFFHKGELVNEHVGMTSKENIMKIVEGYVKE